MSGKPVRVLLADDHPIFRDGLRRLLGEEGSFRVVGEAGDGEEAVRLAQELLPDILLLDIAMPRCSGLEALRRLAEAESMVRTILLTVAADETEVMEAIRFGARGVVLKEATTELLFKAMRTVMAGQYWIGRETVTDLVRYVRDRAPAGRKPAAPAPGVRLTLRERDVVAAIVAGSSNKEIAARFSLSADTVKHHLTSIFNKVGVSTRLELALYAVEHRLIEPSEK